MPRDAISDATDVTLHLDRNARTHARARIRVKCDHTSVASETPITRTGFGTTTGIEPRTQPLAKAAVTTPSGFQESEQRRTVSGRAIWVRGDGQPTLLEVATCRAIIAADERLEYLREGVVRGWLAEMQYPVRDEIAFWRRMVGAWASQLGLPLQCTAETIRAARSYLGEPDALQATQGAA